MPPENTPSPNPPFQPEDFGFFLRPDWKLADVAFYEKDHESIDKSQEKDWLRLNLYLSGFWGVTDEGMVKLRK